ncbi:Cycloserine biosynthesis protein DcsG [Paraconexibacter sp. AEG42_29]|uniref:Cycloserine biosynthesis protein DcsG n=1 Tax=Paraconexibacter sp. AEG42_29 TaxID=2997339 RepID=A0AAU7AZA5_9ACTN
MRTAIATCAQMPDGFQEDDLAAALQSTWVVWDDPEADWAAYDTVLVRSVWDADRRRDEFVAWAHRIAGSTRLLNPAAVLEWNTDKRYLAELPAAGLPTVPTVFLEPGRPLSDDVLAELGTPAELVVKPAQSAGARDTGRFALPAGYGDAAALAARIHEQGKAVMVQPYLAAVDEIGETALLYFGGAYSHAIRKGPILEVGAELVTDDGAADPDISAREPSRAERRLGDAAISWLITRFGGPLAYARVDLLTDGDGEPVVIELELTEPQLYLPYGDGATARLASAVRALSSAR